MEGCARHPARQAPGLLATFNGGFKISTSGGGFYLNGATTGVLTKGVASVVYYRDGRIAIGNWGGQCGWHRTWWAFGRTCT